ncbi:MAG: deoxyribose-phosphate aldolase [Propionibacteriaceae bacterium]
MTRAELARYVDHTLLKPEATSADIAALAAEAVALGTYSICVSPSFLPLAVAHPGVLLATVCGFPSGKHSAAIKAAEAAACLAQGADEIDMVIDLGQVLDGNVAATEQEIRLVKEASGNAVVKVIIESAALTDQQIIDVCIAAEQAGADFVKTSTGFHPAGGASTHAVELMRATVGDRLGVKASGGIRTTASALELIDAGATRLGLSGTKAILDGMSS